MGKSARQRETGVTSSSSSRITLGTRLPESFYSQSTEQVARRLLGRCLFFKSDASQEEWVGGRIIETEAYWGDDPASHSSCGPTPRNSVMFGSPGRAYVYRIYGMYTMLNFVTESEGRGGAVLIRALEPLEGIPMMRERRRVARAPRELASGPGKLCQALGVEMRHNGESLLGRHFWVGEDDFKVRSISVSPRIGIQRARERELRFFLTGHEGISRAPENRQARLL